MVPRLCLGHFSDNTVLYFAAPSPQHFWQLKMSADIAKFPYVDKISSLEIYTLNNEKSQIIIQ